MDKQLIVTIVQQVIANLRASSPSRRVLVLFSGASTGFVAGIEAIQRMADDNHQVTVIFTPSAVKIITEAQVRKAGATDIILPDKWVNAPGLVSDCDMVLVPTLSMNTANRLALGLMDNLMTTLIVGTLLAGKPVIAIRNGADPYGAGGQVFGAQPGVATALKDKFAQNLASLSAFGIELVDHEAFVATVEARLIGFPLTARQQPNPAPLPNKVQFRGKSFITQNDLMPLVSGSAITVPATARFTPLAQDTVKRLRLKVVTQ